MRDRIPPVIQFFVDRCPNVGRTVIVKLLYLSDLEARRYLGRPITDLDYIWWDYGPFDSEILSQLDQLCRDDVLNVEHVCYPGGKSGYRYSLGAKRINTSFSREESAILEYVARLYGRMDLRDLLEEVVYQTSPMIHAKAHQETGAKLEMSAVDNEARVPGLELERVIESVDELDRGRGRPFHDVLERCRAK